MAGREKVQRRIEQREGGAFARAVERAAANGLPAEARRAKAGVTTLDVRRRQRAQRTRHLGQPEIREVALFELRDPLVESHGRG